MNVRIIVFFIAVTASCKYQKKKTDEGFVPSARIGEYVVEVFQDSNENLWFGTLQKGVAKYDGEKLRYYSALDGLPSNRIVSIVEDSEGNLWFGTGEGISFYDGKQFKNYNGVNGLCNNSVSLLHIDRNGLLWIGTWGGVCTYDGESFQSFPIPYPEVSTRINPDTKDWITEIEEDKYGHIWFGRDGYGATRYDGTNFTYYLKEDGLHSNAITEIELGLEGEVWFGSRIAEKDFGLSEDSLGNGGVNVLVENKFTSFSDIRSFNKGDVYEIYNDSDGIIWISTVKDGVYSYDGNGFKHYNVPISIMSMVMDTDKNLWLGGAGGLYRIDRKGTLEMINQQGPWR